MDLGEGGSSVSGLVGEGLHLKKTSLTSAIVEKLSLSLRVLVANAVDDAFELVDWQTQQSDKLPASSSSCLNRHCTSSSDLVQGATSQGASSAFSGGSSISPRIRVKKKSIRSDHSVPPPQKYPKSRPIGVKRLQARLGSKLLMDNFKPTSPAVAIEDEEMNAHRSISVVPGTSERSLLDWPTDGDRKTSLCESELQHPFGTPATLSTPNAFSSISPSGTPSRILSNFRTPDARRNILNSQESNVRCLVSGLDCPASIRPRPQKAWQVEGPGLVLKFFGVLPLNFGEDRIIEWNRYFALALSGCMLLASGYAFFMSLCEACMETMLSRTSDLFLAVGTTVALITSWRLSDAFLGAGGAVLQFYVDRQGVGLAWSRSSSRRLCYSMSLWAISCGSRLTWLQKTNLTAMDMLSVGCFSFMGVLFGALSFSIFHVATSLQILVDAYCARFEHDGSSSFPELVQSVKEWNILVVVLRAASGRLEMTFMILQTVAFGLVVIAAASTFFAGASIAGILGDAPLVAMAMLSFFEVASVTEKCKRVPAFVNALETGCTGKDADLHYLVEHISYSGAGFEVFGVIVDTSMALKIFYLSFMSGLSILTRLLYKHLQFPS